ncbi:MAG: glucosamine-6-phosphate deaminase [Candidatus Hydrogenedentes bacterium]|nr:glucosamine-6-phosphate deaminase [Candidatus Hydrogenedentota bacterium]
MEVIVRPNAEEATRLAARVIAREIQTKPKLVLGLATGRTMERLYGMLVDMHRREGLDFSLITTFNLDEYIGLPPEHPQSYRHYMNHHLFRHVNIDMRNTNLPDGVAPDIDAECARYETAIRECGGIGLQVLGIGRDGHIGFNEPLSAMLSRTRAKALTPTTIRQNAPLFDKPDEMPKRAITMGVGTILDSKRCLMLVTGTEKAAVIAKAVEGPVTSMISASALQLHPNCRVIVDEDAAANLENRDYYDWIFLHEPEWQEFH